MNDPELLRLRERWAVEAPRCAAHPERPAVAFCAGCDRPVCGPCLIVVPVAARCPACQSRARRFLSAHYAWLAGFLGGLVSRRWAAAFALGVLVFAALVCFMPALLAPEPPAVPKYLKELKFRAPFLEQAYRLTAVGDLALAKGCTDFARRRYRRAIAACEAHLRGENDAYSVLQVRLAVGRLLAKAGALDEAVTALQGVIRDAPAQPVAGVAHYYLGSLYEKERQDPATGLEHYRAALRQAGHRDTPSGPLDLLVDYHAGEGAGSQRAYAIAALTDTLASPMGARAEIAEAIEGLTGESRPKARPDKRETPEAGRTPAPDDLLTVIPGR